MKTWMGRLALLVVFALVGCGGGGGGDSSTFAIEGRVLNGVIVGSTVEVFRANDGGVLGTAVTDVNGRFSARVSHQGPYRLRAHGGKLNSADYTGILEALCSGGSVCVVSPHSTVLSRLVDEHGFNPGDAAGHLANSLGFDADPFAGDVPVEDFDLGAARQAIAGGDGLAAWVASMVAWAAGDDAERPAGVGGSGPADPPAPPVDPDPAPPPQPDPDPDPTPDPEPDPGVPVTHTVFTVAGEGGNIGPSSQMVDHGATATFTVTPHGGYDVAAVTGCNGIFSDNTYTTGVITDSCTVSASFSLRSYTVTASAGVGGGIGPSNVAVDHGATGTFTVTTEAGYSIESVSGCGGSLEGNTYTTGVITGACTVEASFLLNAYTVSATAGAGGNISPASQMVEHWATATFSVTPEAGYGIGQLTGCGGSLDGTIYTTGPITGACTVSATFALNQYTLSYAAGPNGLLEGETVQTVSHGTSGTAVTAVPDTGYSFVEWSDAFTANPRTDSNVSGDLSVSASFTLISYNVTATAGDGGSIDPVSQAIDHSNTATFTVMPESGYRIATLSGCGGSLDGNTYTTGSITEACTVEASFKFGTNPINDTGIDWCADAANDYNSGDSAYKATQCEAVTNAGFPEQDGHHGRDVLARAGQLPKIGSGMAGFDYTKISNNGAELPATATLGHGPDDWACTRDNVTGLIWEVKVNNSNHTRHWQHTYTWYDPNSFTGNVGAPNGGMCMGSACDTTSFVQAVNAQTLCGNSDWRMPTSRELEGIVNFGHGSFVPAIDTVYFPNTVRTGYWSGRPMAYGRWWAWAVSFQGGSVWDSDKTSRYGVRLVRGGQ